MENMPSAQRGEHDPEDSEGGGRNLERYELPQALNPFIKIIQIQQLPGALWYLPHIYLLSRPTNLCTLLSYHTTKLIQTTY